MSIRNLARYVAVASTAFCLFGCATIEVKKPEINAVKKIAIVSVTSNFHIHDVADKQQAQSDSDLATLGMSLVDALKKDANGGTVRAQVEIVTHGAADLSSMLSQLQGWSLVPIGDVIVNPAYVAFFGTKPEGSKVANAIENALNAAATSDWVVPQGMAPIAYESVVPDNNGSVTIHVVNGKNVGSDADQTRAALGKLCAALGVDAVVVAQVKLSYKKTFLSSLTGSSLFGVVRGIAKPVVETDIAAVDANGKLIMKSRPAWKVFEGDGAPMMVDRKVNLNDDKGECIAKYNATVDASVKALKEEIAKALK
jgi:hypothetical protein